MKSSITPTKLRLIFIIILILLLAAGVGIFMFGYSQIKTFVTQSQDIATKAEASNSSVENLIATKKSLATYKDTVKRADQLVAESKRYAYQDQIIKDINAFAAKANIGINNITFADAKTTPVASASTAPAPTAPATSGSGSAAMPSTTGSALTGIKSMTAAVTLKNPVDYNNILTFMHLVEQSLFRMQVSEVGLSRSDDAKDPNKVTSDSITIEVYIR